MAKKSALQKIEDHEKLCRIMQKQTFEQIKEIKERVTRMERMIMGGGEALCENILQPVRDHFGRVKVTSGFRSEQLCLKIGSSVNSQHAKAEAADFECMGTDNAELADWINKNLDYDQLILEFYTPGEPNSGWIHCSYVPEGGRKQFLHAYKSEGKTKYKPVIGKATDLI
jgi:hypothetical protein